MKLRAAGKLGELCSEASVPVLAEREKVIGFRRLQYTVYRRGLLKREALPTTTGWVYLTSDRILMLDEGWADRDGAPIGHYRCPGRCAADSRTRKGDARLDLL